MQHLYNQITSPRGHSKHSKINNSTGFDEINNIYLKHLGPLTHLYTPALNTNIITHVWKLANIIPIPKPNNLGTYIPISLISTLAEALEKTILPHITNKICLV